MRVLRALSLVGSVCLVACGGGPITTERDAGADATSSDAALDAPRLDASADAGASDGGPGDAAPVDAAPIDTGPLDAGPSFHGTIAITEVSVAGTPSLGQGLLITAAFENATTAVPPVLEEMPGSPVGCRVWRYTAAEAVAAGIGLDEGTLEITAADGSPVVPPCHFTSARGYACIDATGTGGTISIVGGGAAAFTHPSLFATSRQVGRYLEISGAVAPINDGSFMVVAAPSANTVVFAAPGAVAETLPATATYAFVAGQGPIVGVADPGFLDDGDVLTVALTPGTGADFEPFTTSADVGDDFTLSTEAQATIGALPTDGRAFTLGCAGAGGTCNTALASVLSITTTDGPTAGTAFFEMPPATAQVTVVRCVALAGEITVPAAVSASLASSGATRIRASYLRVAMARVTSPSAPASTDVVLGHGVVGYTTP